MNAPRPSASGAAPATVAEAAPPLDLVFIEGFVGQTVIGVHESELRGAQPVVIDVCLGVPHARACETDRLADTIDYGEVRARLQRLLLQHSVRLLETLAEQVAQIAVAEFGAHWVRVRVAKPRKFDDVASVGVVIERRRAAPPEPPYRATSALRLIGAGMVPGDAGGDAS
jgi:dihydroneopterin aldolase